MRKVGCVLSNRGRSETSTALVTAGSGYGTIASASSPTTFQWISREIQLAAKFTFQQTGKTESEK
jgi:hypothetical protein